jgi:hypothetical protein
LLIGLLGAGLALPAFVAGPADAADVTADKDTARSSGAAVEGLRR